MQLRDDVRAFLEEERFAVLATVNANGSPQQTVMWYELRGDTIVMNTIRGRKKDSNLLRPASLTLRRGRIPLRHARRHHRNYRGPGNSAGRHRGAGPPLPRP